MNIKMRFKWVLNSYKPIHTYLEQAHPINGENIRRSDHCTRYPEIINEEVLFPTSPRFTGKYWPPEG